MSDTSTANEFFMTALHDPIATGREVGLSDEEIIGQLAEAADALREGLSEFARGLGGVGGLVAIKVPDGAGGASTIVMDPLGGRDQIVAVAAGSWTAFEWPLPPLFHASVARFPGIVIDVGANSGFYALLATCAASVVHVLAFEPDQTVFDVLRRNIDANAASGRIEAVALALSSRCGTAALYVPTQEHGLLETSSSLEESFKDAHSEVRPVRTMTLDAFLAEHPRGQQRVTLIKMDVEGHEAAVLEGARQTIARWRPLLFVEVLPQADAAALSRFLSEENYIDVPLRADAPLHAEALVVFHSDAWNHALVPDEAATAFLTSSNLSVGTAANGSENHARIGRRSKFRPNVLHCNPLRKRVHWVG
ncbi:MAG TPA: FkbM family methyltransferase [Acetobacteraceae bacterium]|nr:FkbM family methyltransferase [Acetobacteraceae bacterium]